MLLQVVLGMAGPAPLSTAGADLSLGGADTAYIVDQNPTPVQDHLLSPSQQHSSSTGNLAGSSSSASGALSIAAGGSSSGGASTGGVSGGSGGVAPGGKSAGCGKIPTGADADYTLPPDYDFTNAYPVVLGCTAGTPETVCIASCDALDRVRDAVCVTLDPVPGCP